MKYYKKSCIRTIVQGENYLEEAKKSDPPLYQMGSINYICACLDQGS